MEVTLEEFVERFAIWQTKVKQHPGSFVADMMLDSALSSIKQDVGLASSGERTTKKLSSFLHTALEVNPYHVQSLLRASALRLRLLHFDEAARLLGRAAGVTGPHGRCAASCNNPTSS